MHATDRRSGSQHEASVRQERIFASFCGIATGDAIGKQTENLSFRDVTRWYPGGISGFEGEIRGRIAVVWAPYEFWIDGETSHCGVDVFDFVKIGGEWRVANSMWTVEPDACSELRPAQASTLRLED